MPYVPRETRERIELPYVGTPGELTYVVDKLAEELAWKECGYAWENLSYEILAKIDGALGLAQAEFRRRVVAPYEDAKILQNGDVFIAPHPELWDTSVPEPAPDRTAEATATLREIQGGAA